MATMEALQKLMPNEEGIKTLLGWEPILAWVKLDKVIWEKVAAAMGEEGIADLPMIAAGEDMDYTQAMVDAGIGNFQRARVNLAVNIARAKEGLPLSIIQSKAPPAAAAVHDGAVDTEVATAVAVAAAVAAVEQRLGSRDRDTA